MKSNWFDSINKKKKKEKWTKNRNSKNIKAIVQLLPTQYIHIEADPKGP